MANVDLWRGGRASELHRVHGLSWEEAKRLGDQMDAAMAPHHDKDHRLAKEADDAYDWQMSSPDPNVRAWAFTNLTQARKQHAEAFAAASREAWARIGAGTGIPYLR